MSKGAKYKVYVYDAADENRDFYFIDKGNALDFAKRVAAEHGCGEFKDIWSGSFWIEAYADCCIWVGVKEIITED